MCVVCFVVGSRCCFCFRVACLFLVGCICFVNDLLSFLFLIFLFFQCSKDPWSRRSPNSSGEKEREMGVRERVKEKKSEIARK